MADEFDYGGYYESKNPGKAWANLSADAQAAFKFGAKRKLEESYQSVLEDLRSDKEQTTRDRYNTWARSYEEKSRQDDWMARAVSAGLSPSERKDIEDFLERGAGDDVLRALISRKEALRQASKARDAASRQDEEDTRAGFQRMRFWEAKAEAEGLPKEAKGTVRKLVEAGSLDEDIEDFIDSKKPVEFSTSSERDRLLGILHEHDVGSAATMKIESLISSGASPDTVINAINGARDERNRQLRSTYGKEAAEAKLLREKAKTERVTRGSAISNQVIGGIKKFMPSMNRGRTDLYSTGGKVPEFLKAGRPIGGTGTPGLVQGGPDLSRLREGLPGDRLLGIQQVGSTKLAQAVAPNLVSPKTVQVAPRGASPIIQPMARPLIAQEPGRPRIAQEPKYTEAQKVTYPEQREASFRIPAGMQALQASKDSMKIPTKIQNLADSRGYTIVEPWYSTEKVGLPWSGGRMEPSLPRTNFLALDRLGGYQILGIGSVSSKAKATSLEAGAVKVK